MMMMASSDLLKLQDDVGIARNFVECAFLACEGIPGAAGGAAICAVLDETRTKLEAIVDKLDAIRSGKQAGGNDAE